MHECSRTVGGVCIPHTVYTHPRSYTIQTLTNDFYGTMRTLFFIHLGVYAD